MNWYKKANKNMLYHATYRALLDSIQKTGLTAPVYLSKDHYQAESFAEVGMSTEGTDKDIPEEWFDNIVILGVNINSLDKDYITIDPYNRVDKEGQTYIYNLNIPMNEIKVL